MTRALGHRICALAMMVANAASALADYSARPAATMDALRAQFASCFQPPDLTDGVRLTFYFSLGTKGQALGPPRATLIGFTGSDADKADRLASARRAFARCLPAALDPKFAAMIPGKVYFLQYIGGAAGVAPQVLFRPFGSHYDDGGAIALPRTPLFRQRVAPVILPGPPRSPMPRNIFRPVFPRFPPFVVRPPFRPR